MARPFTWKEVTELEVGQSCVVNAAASEVKRKVTLYGARNGKQFTVRNAVNDDDGGPSAIVMRDPSTAGEG